MRKRFLFAAFPRDSAFTVVQAIVHRESLALLPVKIFPSELRWATGAPWRQSEANTHTGLGRNRSTSTARD